MRAVALVTLALALYACGPSTRLAGEQDIDHLERDLGGPEGVIDMFQTHDAAEVAALLDEYDIGFVEQAVITDCAQYFPAADRSTWFKVTGEYYYVDAQGRPSRAYTDLPPIATEARMTTCQTSVGQWGDAEDPANDYDGGHLIGSQLGGYGGRANVVPQQANFNRGNWVALENKMAGCGSLASKRLHYYISVGYANTTKLVPSTFAMEITNNASGASVSLSFKNAAGGGASGTSEKNRGVAFLDAQGCD